VVVGGDAGVAEEAVVALATTIDRETMAGAVVEEPVHDTALPLIPARLHREAGLLPAIAHPVPVALHIALVPAAPFVPVREVHLHAAGLPLSEVLPRHHHVVAVDARHPSPHVTTNGTARAEDATAAAHQRAEDASAHRQHVDAPPVEAPTDPIVDAVPAPVATPEKAARYPVSAHGLPHLHLRAGNVEGVRTGAGAEAVVQRMGGAVAGAEVARGARARVDATAMPAPRLG